MQELMYDYAIYYGIAIITLIITLIAQGFINHEYGKYAKVRNKKHLTGEDTARMILDENGLENVPVVKIRGSLTDHYDPSKKVVRLSTSIFEDDSISSVAVAAHECGHAIQDKVGYVPMKIRSFLVPIVNVANHLGYIAIIIGLIFGSLDIVWLGILLEAAILLFELVTLPVEINASKRAMQKLKSMGILEKDEVPKARKVLIAAAMTYVAGVLTSALQILRLILIYGDRNRD